ncbi:MAG: gamma-glutamyl-gamma-aminobutyrate hydrolase family protein [Thermoanaerobaculaceae bacterium]|jgi:putative glutamine amidotransferase|nr:gamma-glutamyl-gamma-aminobutyrate hydrolase family protein [Thermoanaerobaculaceae bacterium]
MRILLAHCDHRPFDAERFGAAWDAAGGSTSELVPVTPRTVATVLAGGDTWHGLLLAGGPDVETWRYGQQPEPGLESETDPGRDALDLGLLERAAGARWPVLAVCYGCQILAVAAGGSVIQDLPRVGLGGHRPDVAREVPAHPVRVSDDARFLPAGANLMVNSRHHQAVALPGSLIVVARAPDGVIEAVEGPDPDRLVVGVQWHPEDLRAPEHLDIFRAFRAASADLEARGCYPVTWRSVS